MDINRTFQSRSLQSQDRYDGCQPPSRRRRKFRGVLNQFLHYLSRNAVQARGFSCFSLAKASLSSFVDNFIGSSFSSSFVRVSCVVGSNALIISLFLGLLCQFNRFRSLLLFLYFVLTCSARFGLCVLLMIGVYVYLSEKHSFTL